MVNIAISESMWPSTLSFTSMSEAGLSWIDVPRPCSNQQLSQPTPFLSLSSQITASYLYHEADDLEHKAGYTQLGMHKNFPLNIKPRSKTYVGIEVSNVKCRQIHKSRKIIH
jgi:hypothetical protein